MKIFISQPMHGLTDDEILHRREEAIVELKARYGEDMEILDTFIYEDAPKDANRLWYLGRSIQMLGQADLIYILDGWQRANGCIIERQTAVLYGITREYQYINRAVLKATKTQSFNVGGCDL